MAPSVRSSGLVREGPTIARRRTVAKTKKWTCRSSRMSLQSAHERLWTVLPDRGRVRDLRRAVDTADPPRTARRRPAFQRHPPGPADDLADPARPAPARAGGRRYHHEPSATARTRPRVPTDAGGGGIPRGPPSARGVGSAV